MNVLVRRVVVGWILLVGLFGWLPMIRSLFDGESYQWGTTFFGIALNGAGLSGDLWYLVVKTAFVVFILYALLRRWRPLDGLLATLYSAVLFADNLQGYILDPNSLVFHGDTLGIHLNLSLVSPVVAGTMLFAAIVLWRQSSASGPRAAHPLTGTSLRRLVILGGLLPLQFALLHFGAPHGLTDQAGVILTISQWFLAGWALAVPNHPGVVETTSRRIDPEAGPGYPAGQ